jgi:protein TorT
VSHIKLRASATLGAGMVGVLLLSGCGAATKSVSSGATASPQDSTNWSIPASFTHADGSVEKATYKPVETSTVAKKSKVCVLLPHVKDSLWVAANYGTLSEAQRDGLDYNMFQAGGYGNLSTQVSQMNDCIVQKYDAIVLGAISGDGNCASIKQALDAGIVVVDFINGTACSKDILSNPKFSHAAVSYYDTSVIAGKYLVQHSNGKPRKVGVFPGPNGATFANDAVRGFADAVKGTNVQVGVNRRGDTGLNIQLNMIKDALRAYPDTTDVFGVDIAAEAATVALRESGNKGIGVYGYTIIPGLYAAIESGEAVGAVTDYTPYQGRIAIDQAVRLLAGQQLQAPTEAPVPAMVSAENLKSIKYEDMFGPKDFKPVYQWSPK